MSSKPIYPHVPYFYVIQHVASGKRYAGSRWAKGCNPVEFMTEDGYQTSSPVVKRIIQDEGIGSFVVVEIKTQDEVGSVYEYETKFLVENNCASSDIWLNAHNNTGMSFGTEEFKEKAKRTFVRKYGVENPSQSKEIQRRKQHTCMKNHGVEYSMQSEDIKEKSKLTNLDKRGVEHSFQCEDVKSKSRQTSRIRYGTEHPMQSQEIKEKSRQTTLDRYGFENAMQSQEIKEKSRQTNLKNRGVENPMHDPSVKEKVLLSHYRRIDLKIYDEILNGDFSRFVYLYDTIDHVFVMGVEKSLNRGLETKRFITIGTSHTPYQTYIDSSTGKKYRVDVLKFSVPLPDNFVKIS